MFESILLTIHSWLRWVVLLVGVAAVADAIAGLGRTVWRPRTERLGLWYTIGLDVQLLIGIILAVLTPWIAALLASPSEGAANEVVRFWVFGHILGMTAAVALAHVGRVKARRATDVRARNRALAVFLGLSLAIILAATPWPVFPWGRALW